MRIISWTTLLPLSLLLFLGLLGCSEAPPSASPSEGRESASTPGAETESGDDSLLRSDFESGDTTDFDEHQEDEHQETEDDNGKEAPDESESTDGESR